MEQIQTNFGDLEKERLVGIDGLSPDGDVLRQAFIFNTGLMEARKTNNAE